MSAPKVDIYTKWGCPFCVRAKALLDAIKGFVFHDDSQVARLLVERFEGEREQIHIRVYALKR